MIRIAHLSDLHFGRDVPEVVQGLIEELLHDHPDLIAVSGDLTQRAQESEFEAARAFFDRLPIPKLIVPGNHDMPLYALALRFANPWRRWRRWFSPELEPVVRGKGYCAIGLNSARRASASLDWSRGRINAEQLERAAAIFEGCAQDLHIVVAHHPFLITDAGEHRGVIGRAKLALPHLLASGVDLLLGGHVHLAYSGVADGVVVAQTGTAVSSRLKGEPNSYNRIRASGEAIEIEIREWHDTAFRTRTTTHYARDAGQWVSQSAHQTAGAT